MLAFISYSHIDKSTAAWVKVNFSLLGIDAFMAHDDIEPTGEWQTEILKQLDICDLFVPILTPDFDSSSWTGQETGYAVCRAIPIIPLSAGKTPHAFISKYQAYPLDLKKSTDFCDKMADILANNSSTREEFVDLLIGVFGTSSSFDQAGLNMGRLSKCSEYLTTKQKAKIVELAASNPQIHHSGSASNNLKIFVDEFGDMVEDTLVIDLKKKMRL